MGVRAGIAARRCDAPARFGHLKAAIGRVPGRPADPDCGRAPSAPRRAPRWRPSRAAQPGRRRGCGRRAGRADAVSGAAHVAPRAPAPRPSPTLSTFISTMMRDVRRSGAARRATGSGLRRRLLHRSEPAQRPFAPRSGPKRWLFDRVSHHGERPGCRQPTGGHPSPGRRRRPRIPRSNATKVFSGPRAHPPRWANTRGRVDEERHRRNAYTSQRLAFGAVDPGVALISHLA